jgi:hypothetical protein
VSPGILIAFLAAAIPFCLFHTANLKLIRWIRKNKITYDWLISQGDFVTYLWIKILNPNTEILNNIKNSKYKIQNTNLKMVFTSTTPGRRIERDWIHDQVGNDKKDFREPQGVD